MKPKRKTVWYNYRQGQGVIGTSTVDTGAGVGAPVEAEIGTTGCVAVVMTAGDEYDWFLQVPRDINWAQPVGISVRFSTASTTATDTHTWIALYDVISTGSAPAVGSTALDTTIAVATDNGVSNAWQDTARGVIAKDTFTSANVTARDMLAINIELDATDAAETIHLHGIFLDYMPKRGLGGVSGFDAEYDQEDD